MHDNILWYLVLLPSDLTNEQTTPLKKGKESASIA